MSRMNSMSNVVGKIIYEEKVRFPLIRGVVALFAILTISFLIAYVYQRATGQLGANPVPLWFAATILSAMAIVHIVSGEPGHALHSDDGRRCGRGVSGSSGWCEMGGCSRVPIWTGRARFFPPPTGASAWDSPAGGGGGCTM